MIKRKHYLNIIEPELADISKILFLIGARQVGKSTLLESLETYGYIQADETVTLYGDELSMLGIDTYQALIQYINSIHGLAKIRYLLIDEAQYITNIGLILKVLVDKIRRGEYQMKLIVTGSGSLNVFKGMTDSLVGRREVLHVYPFSFQEFLRTKNISLLSSTEETTNTHYLSYFKEYITYGGYPEVVLADGAEEKIRITKRIISDYVQKDIQLLLEKKEIVKFHTFLSLISGKVGSSIHISQLVEELGVPRYVVEKYFFVIENTFILQSITPQHRGKAKNEIKKRKKIYFCDTGILRQLLGYPEWTGEYQGKVVENFVCNELSIYKPAHQDIHYRGTSTGGEVDFILKDHVTGKIIPIEVKSGNKTNIPRSYSHFIETHADLIDRGYITTKTASSSRGNIEHVPYVQISKIFE